MSGELQVSIGQVQRELSQLVNRVAYSGERIVLTSRGTPKAALVTLEDYEWLARAKNAKAKEWRAWLAESAQLGDDILKRRKGVPVDVDADWQAVRDDLEKRDLADG